MKADDHQYSISDLSRALLREFLSQKGLKKTLLAFEKEDLGNKKKINKNLLIEMLSLKNLFILNKQSHQGHSTLLEILVAYLNKKYQSKKADFTTTEPHSSFPKLSDTQEAQKVQHGQKGKERPASSKPFKSYQLEISKPTAAPLREKEELKVIYQKLNKKEQSKEFRIVESNNIKKLEPPKIEEKPAYLEQSQSSHPFQGQTVSIEDEYKQEFEVVDLKDVIQEQKQKMDENKTLNSSNSKHSQHLKAQVFPSESPKEESKVNEVYDNIKQPVLQKNNHQVDEKQHNRNKQIQKDSKKEQVKPQQQRKGIQQQNINPTPIVHIESQPQQQKKEVKKSMDSSASIPKKEEEKSELVKQEFQQKTRTEMRPLGKKRQQQQSSQKIQTKQQMKNFVPQIIKQQLPKQIEKLQAPREELKGRLQNISKQQIIVNKKVEEPPSDAAPVMVTIGKKRKAKQESNESNYPTKFKFDQNFTHQIPKEVVYQYKEYHFEPITIQENAAELYPEIIIDPAINYKQKGGGVQPIKKKIQKIIAPKDSQRLKKIVFQSSPAVLPKSWVQGFILSPHEQTSYGLKQIEGGPCGIIAAVQCYFLKHLMLCSKQTNFNDETLREVCLVAAITNVLWKVKSTDKLVLAFPPKGASKIQISNLRTVTIEANDFTSAFAGVWSVRDEYIGNSNHGVASLLYSVVITKGFDLIQGEMDIKENPLIGNHGHCTQQFVNLLLTGKACSNCFDGQKILDDYKLKGITQRSQFGFLTIFEALKYLQVGKNLKNPVVPAWVICKQFHYHVIFAPHYLISENSKASKFDIVYFDGLYNCGDRIRLTLETVKQDQDDKFKLKDLPLIEQVMMTKWGRRAVNWNGSTRIL